MDTLDQLILGGANICKVYPIKQDAWDIIIDISLF